MASSSTGSRGEPRFKGTDKPDPGNNEDEVSRYAAAVGNHRVGTTAERTDFTTKGGPWVGLLWYDTTQRATYRYRGGAAGWARDSGFIIDVHPITWTGVNFDFGGTEARNQRFTEGFIPDPGRPYRLSFNARGELGTYDPNTRYNLAVGTGGTPGNHPFAKLHDFVAPVKGAAPTLIRVDTAPTDDVFTGETRVVAQGDLAEGSAFGRLNELNRLFTVTQWAA